MRRGRRPHSIRRSAPMPERRISTSMNTSPEPGNAAAGALYRLLAWLSPAFPIGAFSYSHGLEAAVESGAVHDRASLENWVEAIVIRGSGRMDADILRDAFRAAKDDDAKAFENANRRGLAYRATSELALESAQQGAAFLTTHEVAWLNHHLADRFAGRTPRAGEGANSVCYAAAFGAAAARAGIA